jgi:hypothetical protein
MPKKKNMFTTKSNVFVILFDVFNLNKLGALSTIKLFSHNKEKIILGTMKNDGKVRCGDAYL